MSARREAAASPKGSWNCSKGGGHEGRKTSSIPGAITSIMRWASG